MHLYEKLGAHPMVLDGVQGMAFAVFAPAAQRVMRPPASFVVVRLSNEIVGS
jgi:hypothetical protein